MYQTHACKMMLTDRIATVDAIYSLHRLGETWKCDSVLVSFSPSSKDVSKIKKFCYFPPLFGNFLWVYKIYKHSFVLGMPD